jgi:hypothetical protein
MVEDAAHGYGNEIKERKVPIAFFDQASTQAARIFFIKHFFVVFTKVTRC